MAFLGMDRMNADRKELLMLLEGLSKERQDGFALAYQTGAWMSGELHPLSELVDDLNPPGLSAALGQVRYLIDKERKEQVE